MAAYDLTLNTDIMADYLDNLPHFSPSSLINAYYIKGQVGGGGRYL